MKTTPTFCTASNITKAAWKLALCRIPKPVVQHKRSQLKFTLNYDKPNVWAWQPQTVSIAAGVD